MTTSAESFLAHYGVKGMKWGQVGAKLNGTANRSKNQKPSDDAKAVSKINNKVKKEKTLKTLSNKELQQALDRMRLEQQYSQMTNGLDKTNSQKAKVFVSSKAKVQFTKSADLAAEQGRKVYVDPAVANLINRGAKS